MVAVDGGAGLASEGGELALSVLNWVSLGIGAIAAYSAVQLGRRMAALKAA